MSFEEILRYYKDINTLARSLHGRWAFDELNIRLPDPTSAEAWFHPCNFLAILSVF